MRTHFEPPHEEKLSTEDQPRFPALCAARRPTIVVAEDCVNLSRSLLRHLRRSDFLVRVAGDGIEALEHVRALEPDLLLLDLGLPRLHGLKLLHRLRSAEERIEVPVVVLTGDTAPETWERALRFGVRRVLLKPTPAPEVVAVIEEVLREG